MLSLHVPSGSCARKQAAEPGNFLLLRGWSLESRQGLLAQAAGLRGACVLPGLKTAPTGAQRAPAGAWSLAGSCGGLSPLLRLLEAVLFRGVLCGSAGPALPRGPDPGSRCSVLALLPPGFWI